jgi:hypothetical protein
MTNRPHMGSPHVTLGAKPGARCFYCELDGFRIDATHTAHDERGCKSVCPKHAQWRERTSRIPGHGRDCPERGK